MPELPLAKRHPCFDRDASHGCGRVHLPVAPACNIRCNYCNRRFDCVNESRPGVTSKLLKPHQAVAYMEQVMEKVPGLTVAGIAGPGDPMANPQETLETLRLVHERFPELLLCLSSNGLYLPQYIPDLLNSGVSHLTITVNAVDPEIGGKIYGWARDGKVIYRGKDAASLLLSRQEQALDMLANSGLAIKINTIVVPGVNDHHVEDVAAWAAARGATLMNLIPMHPNVDTPFGNLPEPSRERMKELRATCVDMMPQMTHCKRCRADAVGLLHDDRSREMAGLLARCATLPREADASRPFVAVASRENLLVNQHLGQAEKLGIWAPTDEGFQLLEERVCPPSGGGHQRWQDMSAILKDCRAVLVSGIGETPRILLEESGVEPLEMNGFIAEGLKAVYGGGDLSPFRVRKKKACCSAGKGGGDGMGCM